MKCLVYRVLVASKISRSAVDYLKSHGFEVVEVHEPSEEELVRLIKGFHAIIVRSKPRVTRRVIEAADELKVIARAGVGLDNIDVQAAESRGIKVVNAPESVTQAVAELTVGLMLALLRKIALSDRKMREGMWIKHEAVGTELRGKTLGIVGFGRIGRAVARICYYGFGMKIIYTDKHCDREAGREFNAECVDLDTLLRTADIVSLHVPLTPETTHLINEEKLKLMKKTAILVNTARGAVVDTNALVKALKEGWIAGAALDVFEQEPLPKDHPLLQLDNVVLTPHIGASSVEAQDQAGLEVAKKIVELLK
ncbi:D-2-hydroxyacid dehydrogenase [Thermogladius sp.]|uniref:D-2-hydroxyacid dehydrogenase n=1 Tax=Thermogladius sp. TaxID=2023064 RepID=UPI003D0FB667